MLVVLVARLYYTYPLKEEEDDWKIARELLKLNVDMNARDDQGRTPLQVALEKGNSQVAELLLEHGAERV